ncbi:MAG TPA: PQQ-dependent sugar dehydrogenase [Chitinophagaceae bacterium]|nr:PQQ-dependent sugar dehydrogenase [Chitinophagaceae bacterium]
MKRLFQLLAIVPFIISWTLVFDNKPLEEPDEQRFRKVVLTTGVKDPTDMAILPNGNIIITELNGQVKLYRAATGKTTKTNTLVVANAPESGLLAIALDPQFERKGWVYLVYSPAGLKQNFLSRFNWIGDSLDLSSEKIILRIPDERACCHVGSGLAFDSKGNLFITVGDNTNPFGTNYAPLDERPGKTIYDAQRTSANTKDLRGKVLRIHPEPDGSYSIPQGNLFTDTAEGKPEIFAMGCRNPYKITVDKRFDIAYWGEVGPDASDFDPKGPRGYDELNQGKKAGNYGWPFFIGNNEAYADVDFATETIGQKFEAAAPENRSINNYGIKTLPPAQKPLIWYPYDKSEVFPNLGSGGRTIIAGQFFNFNPDTKSSIAFPQYYDNGLFFADWMRNWIKVVRLNKDGALERIENFMPSTTFQKPISLKFGPDGALYVLEFGSLWGDNTDSRLTRVEFIKGNRAPVAKIKANKTTGALPLKIELSAEQSFDYDKNDTLHYQWIIGGKTVASPGATLQYTFSKPGSYKVLLRVKDKQGKGDTASVMIMAGNAIPDVQILSSTGMFYSDTIRYEVVVTDKEDGKNIDPKNLSVSLKYYPEGRITATTAGKTINAFEKGSTWISESDCKACHAMTAKSVGPSFTSISQKYLQQKNDAAIVDRLATKVITGGKGVWGEQAMNPHPQLTRETATEMIRYILSVAAAKPKQQKLASKGKINTYLNEKQNKGSYVLNASYRDKGGNGIGPLTGTATRVFRSPIITATDFDEVYELRKTNVLSSINKDAFAQLKEVDLTGIKEMVFTLSTETTGTGIEVHLDAPNGDLIGTIEVPTGKWNQWRQLKMPIKAVKGVHDVYFVFKNRLYVLNLLNVQSIQFR